MMRAGLAVVAGFAFVAAAPVAAAGDWVRWGDASVGFEALFPVEPKADSETDGDLTTKSYTGLGFDVLCFVGISDYASIPSVEAELAGDRDNFVKGIEGTVTSSRSTTFAHGDKALPALAFDATGGGMRFRSIVAVEGLRIAMIVGAVPDDTPDDSQLERCVRNFKLLP